MEKSEKRMMAMVFWDHESLLYTKYQRVERKKGRTATKETYTETLYNPRKAIKTKNVGLLAKGVSGKVHSDNFSETLPFFWIMSTLSD